MAAHFEFVPHTGDVMLRVRGATKEALFRAALKGLFAYIAPRKGAGMGRRRRQITLAARNVHDLLIDFLNEINSLSDIHDKAYGSVHFSKPTDTRLKAVLTGTAYTSGVGDIKAATYLVPVSF